MVISDNNKAAFFEVHLVAYSKIPECNHEWLEEILTVQMDLFFAAVSARTIYKFSIKNQDKSRKKHIIYFFAIPTRKRKSQILKALEDFFVDVHR